MREGFQLGSTYYLRRARAVKLYLEEGLLFLFTLAGSGLAHHAQMRFLRCLNS